MFCDVYCSIRLAEHDQSEFSLWFVQAFIAYNIHCCHTKICLRRRKDFSVVDVCIDKTSFHLRSHAHRKLGQTAATTTTTTNPISSCSFLHCTVPNSVAYIICALNVTDRDKVRCRCSSANASLMCISWLVDCIEERTIEYNNNNKTLTNERKSKHTNIISSQEMCVMLCCAFFLSSLISSVAGGHFIVDSGRGLCASPFADKIFSALNFWMNEDNDVTWLGNKYVCRLIRC